MKIHNYVRHNVLSTVSIVTNSTPELFSRYLWLRTVMTTSRKAGYTLIELAITLVIIGLIVGGILVGRDLITASEIRSQIKQIDNFNMAANIFKIKYNYLPGDIPDPDATSLSFLPRCANLKVGNGDGSIKGILDFTPTNGGAYQQGESTLFWWDLATSRLITGKYTALSASCGTLQPTPNPITATTSPSLSNVFPSASIGKNGYVGVLSGTKNYFWIGSVSSLGSGGSANTSPLLTVNQAYAIDGKIDDGLPTTGSVLALYVMPFSLQWLGTASSSVAVSGSSTTCYDNDGNVSKPINYSSDQKNGSGLNCSLSFRFQ